MATRQQFINAAGLAPPQAFFLLATGHYVSHAIYCAATLGIGDLLASSARSYADLAAATKTHAPSLNRLLRLLASAGVLEEQDDGRFALTPIGEFLRSDIPESRRAVALLFAGPNMHRTWSELLYSVQSGEVAFDHVFGMNGFQYLSLHPEAAAIFNQAMTAATQQTAGAVASAYDFSSFKTLADIGGGHGILLTTILKANPALHGILFDLPHVAESARSQIEASGVADRCEVLGGDFFTQAPAGADAYIIKSVIHDWNDEQSLVILRNCHRAMPPEGKLLLVEVILPERVEPSPFNQIIVGSDVNMLVNIGGRERTDAEFGALLDSAGFKLTRIIPTQALSRIIEAERRQEQS